MSLLRFRTLGLLALGLAAVGCSADQNITGEPNDGGYHGDASDAGVYVSSFSLLGLSTNASISLVPGEVLPIVLTLRTYGDQPATGVRVEFALLGPSMDSTLTQLVAYSDGQGTVRLFLQAGLTATSYQLRISIGSLDTFLPITVASVTFGSVDATVSQTATTTLMSVTFRAYADRTCNPGSILDGEPPSSMVTLDTFTSTRTATLDNLVVGTSYAVVADGLANDGTTHRIQCVDGVTTSTVLPEFTFPP